MAWFRIQVNQDKQKITLTQPKSIQNILNRSGMGESNPVDTPCIKGTTFVKTDCPQSSEEKEEMIQANKGPKHYRPIIALANFLSTWTRPENTYIVNKLCKVMANPGKKHWVYLARLLKYIQGTKDHGITYDWSRTSKVPGLHCYSDIVPTQAKVP